VSARLKALGDLNVLAWIDAQRIDTLFLSTISLAEPRFGIAILLDGNRRDVRFPGRRLRYDPA
jgi:hypothetical protein